jgi:V8-like Glu-specific endopeptidase
MKKLLCLTLLLSFNSFANQKVIYGDDNRVDWYEANNTMYRDLALSTAGMISKSSLIKNNDSYTISGVSLRGRGICADERFANQITAANCSGFLVGEDLLVTAGHCITSQSDCSKYAWVFDYRLKFKGDKAKIVSHDSVYNCKKIIERKLDSFNRDDYALIQLDRKVVGKTPLEYRRNGKIKRDEQLVVIGHPTGLPTKIADGAKVRKRKGKFFVANLDTYGGNSGSAVFNAKTGLVEGILVRGATDYVSRNGCRQSNQIGNNAGRGEDVTYITNIQALK